jgi:PadR family transcriptional regulator AphA
MRGKTNPFPSFEYALLGFLYSRPTHGYELHKLIADPQGIGTIWGVKMSNLYAQLEKLEKKGYVEGVLQPGESHPARTQYHISDEGKRVFSDWLSANVIHPRDFRQEFMLRYFFLYKYQPDLLPITIDRQISECKKWLTSTSGKNSQITQKGSYVYNVIEFRRSQIKSMIGWLEWLLTQPVIQFINEVKK